MQLYSCLHFPFTGRYTSSLCTTVSPHVYITGIFEVGIFRLAFSNNPSLQSLWWGKKKDLLSLSSEHQCHVMGLLGSLSLPFRAIPRNENACFSPTTGMAPKKGKVPLHVVVRLPKNPRAWHLNLAMPLIYKKYNTNNRRRHNASCIHLTRWLPFYKVTERRKDGPLFL